LTIIDILEMTDKHVK